MKRSGIALVALSVAAALWYYTETSHSADQAAGEQKTVLDCSCTRVLNDFGDERVRDALFRHFCASADWRVTAHLEITQPNKSVRRVIEAEKRVKGPRTDKELEDIGLKGGTPQVNVTLRFASPLDDVRRKGNWSLAKAGANAVDVSLFKSEDSSGAFGSCLAIEASSITLLITERNTAVQRPLTQKAMKEAADELSAIRDNVETVLRQGYLRRCLPNKSIRESVEAPALEIREGAVSGEYWVSGYVNGQEKGYITIRTFDASTGKELEAEVNQWRTIEYVGWSSRAVERFFFESELEAPGSYDEKDIQYDKSTPGLSIPILPRKEIRVEVWFHGKRDRKVLEATKSMVPWMR